MNTYPLIAIGVTSLNSKKQQLDVRYLLIVNKDSQILNPLNLDHPGYDELQTLVENEKDIEAVAKFFVKSAALKYIREFQEAMSDVERNKLQAINMTNTIYKYIFN